MEIEVWGLFLLLAPLNSSNKATPFEQSRATLEVAVHQYVTSSLSPCARVEKVPHIVEVVERHQVCSQDPLKKHLSHRKHAVEFYPDRCGVVAHREKTIAMSKAHA